MGQICLGQSGLSWPCHEFFFSLTTCSIVITYFKFISLYSHPFCAHAGSLSHTHSMESNRPLAPNPCSPLLSGLSASV